MSHVLCVWVTNYMYISHELNVHCEGKRKLMYRECIWVMFYVYESRTIHKWVTNYAYCEGKRKLMYRECIWVMFYVYESRTICTWVTDYVHCEVKQKLMYCECIWVISICMSHELCVYELRTMYTVKSSGNWSIVRVWVMFYVYESRTICMWVTNYVYDCSGIGSRSCADKRKWNSCECM